MTDVFVKCPCCSEQVILPEAEPHIAADVRPLDKLLVRLLMSEMSDVVSGKDYPEPYMKRCREALGTLQTINSEYLEAERGDDGTV